MRARLRSPWSLALFLLLGASASAQTITEFPLSAGSAPFDIVAGPDGNLWFTNFRTAGFIGRISKSGEITEFPVPGSAPTHIVEAADGNLWFAQPEDLGISYVSRIRPNGEVTQFRQDGYPYDIAAGGDGNLWLTHSGITVNAISRVTTSGAAASFPIPAPGFPSKIASGLDGALWFTHSTGRIGRITTSGVITQFPIPGSVALGGITAGPDGAIWFTDSVANFVGRLNASGEVTRFEIPTSASAPSAITAGPDGNLWFTEQIGGKIGRLTTSGNITEFPLPTPGSNPTAITVGPDGNIWFTEWTAGKIGRLSLARTPAIETRILPVVGSTPGAGGSFFRTSVQLHNSTAAPMTGQIVFHPSGSSGRGSDPVLAYSLAPGQTQSIADLLPAIGRSGLGSADVEVTSGGVPAATVRVFNDAGAAGTTGFTEDLMRAEEALRPAAAGVLLLPADMTRFRFNLGVRTLESGATATMTLRDAVGAVVGTISRAFEATYHEQQSAAAFLGVPSLPAGGSVTIAVTSGSAIFYGATVDNITGDPSLQIARVAP